MATWIAFLRGINVGGRGTPPMKELVSLLEDRGRENVRPYIQNGNSPFEASKVTASGLPKWLPAPGTWPRITCRCQAASP